MKRNEVIESVITPILEITGITIIFFFAYFLRSITDGIPFIQLPIPYISQEQFLPFVISWALFWWIIFSTWWLYRYDLSKTIFEEIRQVIIRSSLWFFFYIGFIYLSTGFLFQREIPRLIILYVWILATVFSITLRITIKMTMRELYNRWYLEKKNILILLEKDKNEYSISIDADAVYKCISTEDREEIYSLIREKKVDKILLLDGRISEDQKNELITLCSIYWVRFAYPKILPQVYDISRSDTFIWGILVVESSALSISPWERVMKRTFDILLSFIGLLILSPFLLIIAIAIKIEDPSGPIIYKNRRIGLSGKEFFLYKFRYMQWKFCVKDSYGIDSSHDEALKYEEKLKKKSDTRDGPLYKIKDDPRKTKVWKIIEQISLDELPQLYNVLLGNMSLIWPRPHQPREVSLYEERHYQLLTIKPGITGMAQVYGREKNSFEEEVGYDTYYIEHYSILLDMLILAKTFFVVLSRAFR